MSKKSPPARCTPSLNALQLAAALAVILVCAVDCRAAPHAPSEEIPEPVHSVPIPPRSEIRIENPYAAVDWSRSRQHRANLHTHSRNSDGLHSPARVIDLYREASYAILAISDHNHVTWPWTEYNRDPEKLGMLAVQANEISDTHHIGSYFCDYDINGRTYRPIIGAIGQPRLDISEEEVFEGIGEKDGLAVFFHPGRYDYPAQWYVEFYQRFDHVVGLEVVNQRDRYPQDRALWDTILSAMMPQRPVWGFSNDDFHRMRDFGHAYNVFPLAEFSEHALRTAMENGSFYFSNGAAAPVIDEVIVDNEAGMITVAGRKHDTITWISEGRHVQRGSTLAYRETPAIRSYLRAELHGPGGITYTNPFTVLETR